MIAPSGSWLQGKLALVTGSSRGIGRSIALELARQGADIIVNYRANAGAAASAVAAIEAFGRAAIALQANIGNSDEVAELFKAIGERFGGLDILVLNAGTGWRTSAVETPIKALHTVMAVNLVGPWLCVEAAVPLMRARGGGRIVAITSSGTQRVFPQYVTTGASKAALEALVRYLAVELAPDNIVVNAIAPGLVRTEALERQATPEYIAHVIANTPLKRAVRPEEVGYLTAFLCSEGAAMICGQVIAIDGGLFLPALPL